MREFTDGKPSRRRRAPAASARERILSAAGELFAESGFAATPTSRIAERAGVPKGLIHYYFRRKPDLLVALVDRLPAERVDVRRIVVPGDVAGTLRRLVAELDRRFEATLPLHHLLWREADTHSAVRRALRERFRAVVAQVREVVTAAAPAPARADVDTAAVLLARVIDHRHAVAARAEHDESADREIEFIARGLGPR
ncbi:TetR/AcrR family transcriptional regulator [Saccharopolyspora sp. 7B]|uniref:TetR/AcrR family transcriptional regulator n=1 Tax=Saccharopolyspora sp. 7B TaxID=2877240 RepID=UPI001CD4E53C|nr:TetR/AcrR family transcriptional regulator [Saccharopolyspora sp. 7B]MCA1278820.1 TetR/AcrR family transcriptional regulator [Saccharopolyspora sp. 7B]